MRRVRWSVLTGLGVFFIVLALLSKFFVPGQAVKFPLNEYQKMDLQAVNASYFSKKFLTEESGVTLEAVITFKGEVAAAKSIGSSKTAVWQTYTPIRDLANHTAVSIPARPNVLAFDRKTGALVPWSGNSVDGKRVTVSGHEQWVLWPIGTQKKDYKVFDTTLMRPVTFRYTGITSTDGVSTYVFKATIHNEQIGTQSLPGSLVGMAASEVTLPEYYSATDTYFVDPVTGVPVAIERKVNQTLQDGAGTTRLVLLSADFQTTPESVTSFVNTDNAGATKISLLNVTIPIVGGLLGIVLLGAGLVLSRRPEDDEYEDDEETVGAAV
jgi:DUF3068 family protein